MINFIAQKKPDYKNIMEILSISEKKNIFTNHGPVKFLLEQKLEELLKISPDKRIICLSSGTAALHALFFLCEIKYNIKKWAIPAFNFPSAVVGNSYDVSIIDIDPTTFTIPESKISEFNGIVITNLFGSYVDLDLWSKITKNKILIFDNASSPLSTYKGINICNFGNYSIGSLHHTKYLGFGEGGFAVIPKEDYKSLSAIANFGFMNDRKYNKLSSNFKMSDISAAFILSHIENYDIGRHLKIQNKLIKNINIEPLNYKEGTVYGNLPLVFKEQKKINKFKNITVHKYYKPLAPLKNSIDLYKNIINFPLYSELTDNKINKIIKAING